MPPAIIAPIAGAVISTGLGVAAQAAMKPDGPKKLDEGRQKTLGKFASGLADEEGQFQNNRDGMLLRPGGRRIGQFMPQTQRPYQARIQTRPSPEKLKFT